MIYHALTIAMLFLAACSPMPGAFGLIDGVARVHDLGEVEVVEHAGTFRETAAACNKGLGFFRDDPARLRAAIRYLKRG